MSWSGGMPWWSTGGRTVASHLPNLSSWATLQQSISIEKHHYTSRNTTSGLLPPRWKMVGIDWTNNEQWTSEKTRPPHRESLRNTISRLLSPTSKMGETGWTMDSHCPGHWESTVIPQLRGSRVTPKTQSTMTSSVSECSDVNFPEKYLPEHFWKFSGNFPKNRTNIFVSWIIILALSSTANIRYFVYVHIIYRIKTKQSTSIRYSE